jgi:plastocyanin
MRKALWSAAALIALLSGATLTWAPRARAADASVEIGKDNKFKYEPAEISVPVNSKVDWTNKSAIQHDVKADSGLFKSELLNKDQTYSFTFTTPGEFRYVCTVSGHEDAGMVGVVKVTGGAPATTATTAPGATTTTTAPVAGSTTTTTAKAATGGSTTTTTAGGGTTSTTQAPSVTPTSAPETGGVTTTTTAAPTGGGEEAAADGHGGEESKSEGNDKSSPLGIAFASVSTLLLLGISGKLLASKS